MAQVTVTMADRGTAIMAAMPQRITAGTPQRTTTTATLPHTTADMDRVTMLPPIMVPGTGALFARHTRTMALGTIAGIVIAGEARHDAEVQTTKGRRDVCGLFCADLGLVTTRRE